MIEALRSCYALYGYTQMSVHKAITELEASASGDDAEVMMQRAKELEQHLEKVTDFFETF